MNLFLFIVDVPRNIRFKSKTHFGSKTFSCPTPDSSISLPIRIKKQNKTWLTLSNQPIGENGSLTLYVPLYATYFRCNLQVFTLFSGSHADLSWVVLDSRSPLLYSFTKKDQFCMCSACQAPVCFVVINFIFISGIVFTDVYMPSPTFI